MHDHLEEGDGRDADILEVVGIGAPWFCGIDLLLLVGGVGIKCIAVGVDEFDVVVELWRKGWLVCCEMGGGNGDE